MYADAAVFATNRLKPAKHRYMTVEIDQAELLRNPSGVGSPPTATMLSQAGPIGTPSIISTQSSSTLINSPTTSTMSTPTVNDNIINRRADPAQGLYQTCLTLRERLKDVPDFEKFLDPPDDADPDMPEDPVTQLWRCFRMGSSLCVLFNATRPVELIREERLSPKLKTMNDCKAATFHFLKGIKNDLHIEGDDAFMIHNLYADDTNGFVKVTKTVSKILDILQQRNLLLNRGDRDRDANADKKKALDPRARVVQELVDTERKYVQDLENLQEYMRALEQQEVLSKDLIHNIFLNLNNLVDFQRRFLIRVETQNDLVPEQQNWGCLFVQYEKSFSVYEPYAANFNAALTLAQEEKEKLARMPHPVYDQLAAFLIKPVQRVTKYPLLLRDLIKHTDPISVEDQQLPQGLEAIERIAYQINEAIRKSENVEVVKDLEGRVEDWKGHKLEHFGELLLHGQFSVIKGDQKGDVEREYYIYLFERILLCCKEIGANKKQNKTMSMSKNTRAIMPKKKTSLQLKGRIFMQNVTDVISLARGGSYTLQIFWKGDPGVENFMIKHSNEETLSHWKKTLQKQREIHTRADTPVRGRGSAAATTQFAWMANSEASDPRASQVDSDADEEDDAEEINHYSKLSSNSRNGSSSNLRSRSATNEGMADGPPGQFRPSQPPIRYQPPAHTPPLRVVTNPSAFNNSSPDKGSYFSPTVETPMTGIRTSSSSSQQGFPFPRAYDDPNRRTPPHMSRTPSREGAPHAYQNGRVPNQRPSLPGMGGNYHQGNAAAAAAASQVRMRSISSPGSVPNPSSQLSRGNGNIPPIPSVPTYIPWHGGPANTSVNRSQNSSPTSPQLPIQGQAVGRTASPAIMQDGKATNGTGTPVGILPATSPAPKGQQVKVKIHYNNDKLAIIVPYNIAYAQLMDRIERKVKICGNGPEISPTTPIRIKYQDEDGDFISMNSDDDVQMAFDVACEPGAKDSTGTGSVTLYVQVG